MLVGFGAERADFWHSGRVELVMPAPSRCLLLALVVAGCATQREQRLSSAGARERPTDEACEPRGKRPTPTSEWACAYWHWNGVRYVWVEGNWQERP